MKYLILLLSLNSFGMGGSKPKWYDGPSERKSTMQGWINHAISCMPAPSFKKENVKIKYIPKKGEKRFSTCWAYKNSQNRWVCGETYLNSNTSFTVYVATTPDGQWDQDAHETEGHEIGHVIAYNQFGDSSHNSKWSKCFAGWNDKFYEDEMLEAVYDENGDVIYDHGIE